ncbi:uncharacterized protein [Ptychodera flava]|uniref:uncharacterized protein isoform X2 n=1 Tax=Ptychodera flava TaxID=63121 RepID=UPI00396A147F
MSRNKAYMRFDSSVQETPPPSPGLETPNHDFKVTNGDTAGRSRQDSQTEADTEYTTESAQERLLPNSKAKTKKHDTDVEQTDSKNSRTVRKGPSRGEMSVSLNELLTTLHRSTPRSNFNLLRLSPDSPGAQSSSTSAFFGNGQPLDDPPPDNLCCAICSIFFCSIVGVFAIHQSWMSRKAAKVGDRFTAEESGRYALQLSWAGIFLGIIIGILFVVVFITPHYSRM